MKVSISWIFDHINAEYTHIDMPVLANLFNQRVAEIEGFYTSTIDLSSLYMAQISATGDCVDVLIPELGQGASLPVRADVCLEQWYVIKKGVKGFGWATELDFGGQKDTLLPCMACDEHDAKGAWREACVAQDYILEVDNKSITHRPDMWGHRGFAREIALLLELPLKPLEKLVTSLPIEEFIDTVPATAVQPFSARIVDTAYINRFAFAYFAHIQNGPSLPWMASRLCRIGLRPIDVLVDMTNYVMCDLGQPMHAFDANGISAKHFELRLAREHEKLTLLDGDTIELTEKDMVITDGTKPISLAGVMGGKETQIVSETTSMVLESAHFDATSVRESAARHKKRTEASTRFEKTLDPNQNIQALERFVRLLHDADVSYKVSGIASMGLKAEELAVTIDHAYIEKRLGVELAADTIVALLHRLEFQVTTSIVAGNTVYHVRVPTFRCTKDVRIKEDVLEEIARSFGYTNIPFVLPSKQTKPSELHEVYMVRRIKQLLAYGNAMREVANYSFYDEDFLRELQWQPHDPPCVQSPVSENWKALVGSLIPGLLKNVVQNHAEHETLHFFEWGRVWHKKEDVIVERKQLAGIWYDQKKPVSYYTMQSLVMQIAHMVRLPISWRKINEPAEPWFAPYQSAHILYGDVCIGTVGVLDSAFTHHVVPGHAAAFVLDGDFLAGFYGVPLQFKPSSKFPSIRRDMSVMVPLTVTVEQIQEAITTCSPAITHVKLVDMFKKDDWLDTKSLTFSYTMQDAHKTLTTHEADEISAAVLRAVQALGAQVR